MVDYKFQTFNYLKNLVLNVSNLVAANIPIDCDSPFDEVTDSGTTITSPNYPSNYDNGKDCQVTIRFAADQIVSITLESFDVESHSTCAYDYLAVHDGDSTCSNLIGPKLCGTDHAGLTIRSTGNTMTLHFHADGIVRRSGFKINVNSGKKYDLPLTYIRQII